MRLAYNPNHSCCNFIIGKIQTHGHPYLLQIVRMLPKPYLLRIVEEIAQGDIVLLVPSKALKTLNVEIDDGSPISGDI